MVNIVNFVNWWTLSLFLIDFKNGVQFFKQTHAIYISPHN